MSHKKETRKKKDQRDALLIPFSQHSGPPTDSLRVCHSAVAVAPPVHALCGNILCGLEFDRLLGVRVFIHCCAWSILNSVAAWHIIPISGSCVVGPHISVCVDVICICTTMVVLSVERRCAVPKRASIFRTSTRILTWPLRML